MIASRWPCGVASASSAGVRGLLPAVTGRVKPLTSTLVVWWLPRCYWSKLGWSGQVSVYRDWVAGYKCTVTGWPGVP